MNNDGDEPTTADWLESVLPGVEMGGDREYFHAWRGSDVRRRIIGYIRSSSREWVLSIDSPCGQALIACPTRKQVRAICAVFGVPLRDDKEAK